MGRARLAKLTRPHSEGLLQRHRLFSQLDELTKRPVTWIEGPPGSGKTSLLASYLEVRKRVGIWYQIDSNDADCATFFHYLSIALADIVAGKRTKLQTFQHEFSSNFAGFSRAFFRALYHALPEDSWIVLDNFQECQESEAFRTVIREALEEIPMSVRLVVISRTEPTQEFSRCIARRDLAQVQWGDLRLTRSETSSLAAGYSLNEAQLTLLQTQSDGWAAGVILMLERLRQTGKFGAVASSENLETVFAYFADQVFDTFSFAERMMLMRMSYLPTLTVETAEIITGDPAASQLLRDLAKRHLFTDRRAGPDESYQFHYLFRTFLQTKSGQLVGSTEHRHLAHSAATILQTTGQIEEAYQLFVLSGSWDNAIRIVLKEADKLVQQGRRQTLIDWIQALPVARLNDDPWLLYWLAHGLVASETDRSRRLLEEADSAFTRMNCAVGSILCATLACTSYYGERRDRSRRREWTDRLRACVENTKEELPIEVEVGALNCLIMRSARVKPIPSANDLLLNRLKVILERPCPADLVATCAYPLLAQCWWTGNLAGAERLVALVEPKLERPDVLPAGYVAWNWWLALYLAYAGEYKKAHAVLDKLLVEVTRKVLFPTDPEIARIRAAIYRLSGDDLSAMQILKEQVEPTLETTTPSNHAAFHFNLGVLQADRGDLTAAEGSTKRALELAMLYREPFVLASAAIAHLFVLAMAERSAAYEEVMSLCVTMVHAGEVSVMDYAMALAEAYRCLRSGDQEQFQTTCNMALRLGTEHRFLTAFTAPTKPVIEVLAAALRFGIEVDYVYHVIRVRGFMCPYHDLKEWPRRIRIFALGNFEVRGEHAAKMGTQYKLMEILRALVAMGPDPVSTEKLADALWPENDGDAAHNNLQVSLHRLRKILGESVLGLQDGKVSINREQCFVDSWAFESMADTIDTLAEDSCDANRLMNDALALYRGHFLSRENERPWQFARRNRLKAKWIRLLQRLSTQASSPLEGQSAYSLLVRASEIDPEDAMVNDFLRSSGISMPARQRD